MSMEKSSKNWAISIKIGYLVGQIEYWDLLRSWSHLNLKSVPTIMDNSPLESDTGYLNNKL